MKRQDIEIGTEYAATAALAYGREPRTAARRVRFTDTRPGPWWRVITSRWVDNGNHWNNGPGWKQINVELVRADSERGREVRDLPTHMRQAIQESKPAGPKSMTAEIYPIGTEITYLDTSSAKGGLPGEYWDNLSNSWRPTLVIPAEIHRTWAEIAEQRQQRIAENAELEAKAKIPEIRAALKATGLDALIRVSRSGHGVAVQINPVNILGERWYADLTKWANDRRPAGWGEVVDPS